MLQKQGTSIVLDPEKDKSMVQDLLDFKEQLDSIIEDAFMRSEKFVNSMKVLYTWMLSSIFCKLIELPVSLQNAGVSVIPRNSLKEHMVQLIYSLLFNVTKDTRLAIFQHKIIHHILPQIQHFLEIQSRNMINVTSVEKDKR